MHQLRARVAALCALLQLALPALAILLPGFTRSPYWGEQLLWREGFYPGDVQLHINAPAADLLDPAQPTRLILFFLPNGSFAVRRVAHCASCARREGNTINQTVGKDGGRVTSSSAC